MKFIIKNNKEKSEPKIELWLKDNEGGIDLMGKDETGEERFLMIFRNGKFSRNDGAELEGLETDIDGKITEE